MTADPSGRPVSRSVLSDNVYEAVKALVMNHDLPPGSRVNIDALARQLDVSQTPLREALARLEADGLVVKQPLRGYTTSPLLGRAALEDLYDLRLLLEPWATARATENASGRDRARLRAELATCKAAPRGGDYEAYKQLTAHDARFHDLIMELSGNAAVREAFARTHVHLHVFRLYYGSGLGTRALQEHRAIVRAIAAGEPDAAAEAMRAHLVSARDRLVKMSELTGADTPQP